MSPSPVVDSSPRHDRAIEKQLNHLQKNTSLESPPIRPGWIATSVEVQSELAPNQAMTLQSPDAAAARAGHDRQWVHNGSEKSFHSFPSMSLSDDSMEHGIPPQKEQGSGAKSGVKRDLVALLNLMALIPFVSLAVAIYALLATLVALISLPLRLCISTRPPLATQIKHRLLPALNLHLKSACSYRRYYPPPPPSDTPWPGNTEALSPASRDSHHADTTSPSLPRLFTVLLTSPILSLPIACSAFVLAIFWMLSALTTDETADAENGRASKRTLDDGRWLAKRLRRWWVRWLSGELFDGRAKTTRARRTGARSSRR